VDHVARPHRRRADSTAGLPSAPPGSGSPSRAPLSRLPYFGLPFPGSPFRAPLPKSMKTAMTRRLRRVPDGMSAQTAWISEGSERGRAAATTKHGSTGHRVRTIHRRTPAPGPCAANDRSERAPPASHLPKSMKTATTRRLRRVPDGVSPQTAWISEGAPRLTEEGAERGRAAATTPVATRSGQNVRPQNLHSGALSV
jgi:hypothetical protein